MVVFCLAFHLYLLEGKLKHSNTSDFITVRHLFSKPEKKIQVKFSDQPLSCFHQSVLPSL